MITIKFGKSLKKQSLSRCYLLILMESAVNGQLFKIIWV